MRDTSQGRLPVRVRVCVCLAMFATAILIGVIWFRNRTPWEERLLSEGRSALERKDFATARQKALQVLRTDPRSTRALLLAGDAAAALKDPTDALRHYDRIPDTADRDSVTARCAAGDLLLSRIKHLSRAEEQFRRAVQVDSEDAYANNRMSLILDLGVRMWESIPYKLAALRAPKFEPGQVSLLALDLNELPRGRGRFVPEFAKANPDDPVPMISMARLAIQDQRNDIALRLLQGIVRRHPEYVEAWIDLGHMWVASADEVSFLRWHEALPPMANRHPEIWAIRGAWARHKSEPQVAARCYWESIHLNPNSVRSNFQLGQLLTVLNREQEAAVFLDHAQTLQEYASAVDAGSDGKVEGGMKDAAEFAESLGLFWEAYGWATLCLDSETVRSQPAWAVEMLSRLKPRLPPHPQNRELAEFNVALRVDLSAYPLPNWQSQASNAPTSIATRAVDGTVNFEDLAVQAGLNFSYYNGDQPLRTEGMQKMYEFTGGGVVVLDYDCDGYPDCYFTQGCEWPPQANQQEYVDRLFRNLGGSRFEDVTELACVVENSFSQGATIGDFNSDGFPDIYVANIGHNRLFQNNGDGTFTDVTANSGLTGDRWTTSSLMADLNGDSLPDIYDVNYLAGEDLFTKVCWNSEGKKSGTCPPNVFPAAQDQMYLNLGDGRFEEVTGEVGIVVPDGKGLGIVAADFDGSGRLSLFVANDQVPNFFFHNRTDHPGDRPRFLEQGFQSGLAVDLDGKSQACMGVAAGDADGDGLVDLFVTNFANESNTLYRNVSGNLFLDDTKVAGLREPSLAWLGFGTQFIDGELDGWLDLIVANGHVTDERQPGKAYQMPPQYFRNLGKGRFVELTSNSLGPYFEGQYLGRGLARLDWNGDGLEDVAISHLDRPASLLTNTSEQTGHFLVVALRGVKSDRDAIGATVTVKAGERSFVRQLTAGDGYHASNERVLTFGIGAESHIEFLRVRWPSRFEQEWNGIECDTKILCLEGRAQPIRFWSRIATANPN